MASLLCDLVRVLSHAAAVQLRERATDPDVKLTRGEALALATLFDLNGTRMAASAGGGPSSLDSLLASAQADLRWVESARGLRR
jgi:hypothetical protein